MRDDPPDFHGLAASMSCHEDVLVDLGRVSWAATRLRAKIHVTLESLRGDDPQPPRWPWIGPSLAEDVRELELLTEGSALAEWCRTVVSNAISAHDAVIHEVVHGTPLNDSSEVPRPPERSTYGRRELIEVTGRLINAANTMPTAPTSPAHAKPGPPGARSS